MSIWIGCVALLAQAGSSLPPALACEQAELSELNTSSLLMSYATAIAVDRNRIVVGAPDAGIPFIRSGAVWIYLRANLDWKREVLLQPLDNAPLSEFGSDVAIDGNVLLAGAAFHDGTSSSFSANRGAAYVFRRGSTEWTQEDQLFPSNPTNGAEFGASVAVDGDTALVGAPGVRAAYVFQRRGTAWVEQAELTPTTNPHDFGAEVAVDGDLAAVFGGASVHVFARSGTTWSLEANLSPSDALSSDDFGRSIALDGDRLVAGSPFHETMTSKANQGAVYVYLRTGTTWSIETKLLGENAGDLLGTAVDIDRDRLVASAPRADLASVPDAGEVKILDRVGSTWVERTRLRQRLPESTISFGLTVAVSRATVAVGAPYQGFGLLEEAAHAFFLMEDQETYCVGKLNSVGCVPFISTCGTPSPTSPDAFRILGQDMRTLARAQLVYGFAKTNLDFHGGKLCVKAQQRRVLPPRVVKAFGPAPCKGLTKRDFNAVIQSGSDPLLTPGRSVYAQWIQADADNPIGFRDSLTDAVRFTIQP